MLSVKVYWGVTKAFQMLMAQMNLAELELNERLWWTPTPVQTVHMTFHYQSWGVWLATHNTGDSSIQAVIHGGCLSFFFFFWAGLIIQAAWTVFTVAKRCQSLKFRSQRNVESWRRIWATSCRIHVSLCNIVEFVHTLVGQLFFRVIKNFIWLIDWFF